MTNNQKFEEGRKEIKAIYEEKKDFNQKLKTMSEERMKGAKLDDFPQAKAHHALASLTFKQFADMYDNLEKLTLITSEAIENISTRIAQLEISVQDIGGKINRENIIALTKFAQDFSEQVAKSKKDLQEYKRKMVENDLAT